MSRSDGYLYFRLIFLSFTIAIVSPGYNYSFKKLVNLLKECSDVIHRSYIKENKICDQRPKPLINTSIISVENVFSVRIVSSFCGDAPSVFFYILDFNATHTAFGI